VSLGIQLPDVFNGDLKSDAGSDEKDEPLAGQIALDRPPSRAVALPVSALGLKETSSPGKNSGLAFAITGMLRFGTSVLYVYS